MPAAIAPQPAQLSAQALNSTLNSTGLSPRTGNLIFIDPNIQDWPVLAEAALPGSEVYVLEEDAIFQIAAVLAHRNDIRAVHIFSHGSPGCLYLGQQELSVQTIDRYAKQLQTWFTPQFSILNSEFSIPQPSLLLYGCNVAAGSAGDTFLDRLHQLTGVNIAASTSLTGSRKKGGDWKLEERRGEVRVEREFEGVFEGGAIANYPHTLDWTQIGGALNGEQSGELAGFSVALAEDGRTVAIGSTLYNNGSEFGTGRVRIYQNLDGAWSQIGDDILGEAQRDQSGWSVALAADGNTVAIGALNNDGQAGSNSGHVRVYRNNNGTWAQVGEDIDGEAVDDQSGRSIALSDDGNIVAVGAARNRGRGNTNSGHVRIFENVNDVWQQIGEINGATASDGSGFSVSLSANGQVVAIGAVDNDSGGSNSGHVRVFRNNSGLWEQIGSEIKGAAADDQSGFDISLSDDGQILAIGARGNDQNGIDSGHVRIYRNIEDTWSQIGDDITGSTAGDEIGFSVALSDNGSTVAIGAINSSTNGTDSGLVRVYRQVNDTWTQIGNDFEGQVATDFLGFSVALSESGDTIAISTPQYDEDNFNDRGQVRIYELTETLPPAPPTLTLSSHIVAYTENTESIQLSPAATVADPDSPDFDGGILTVGFLNGSTADDRLTIRNQGTGDSEINLSGNDIFYGDIAIGNYSGGEGTQDLIINLNANANPTNVEALVQNLSYSNVADTLNGGSRTVEITLSDGDGNTSEAVTQSIIVTAAEGEAPVNAIDNIPFQIFSDIEGAAAFEQFGHTTAISEDGSVIAISSKKHDVSRGHVRIYRNDNGGLTQIGNDIDGEAAFDVSGIGLALSDDGSTVAIGAPGNRGNASFRGGHVRIFRNQDDTWVQVGSDINGSNNDDQLGQSVALSQDGRFVAIGARLTDVGAQSTGSVQVYQEVEGAWEPVGDAIHGEGQGDQSGTAVAISDDGRIVAIAARNNDGNGDNSGHVRVYQNLSGTWTQIGNDIDGSAAGDNFGQSVSLSADGDLLAVGAIGTDGEANDRGYVRVYQNIDDVWTQLGSDILGEAAGDRSGFSVSLSDSGDILAIGALNNDGNGENSGQTRLYTRLNDQWIQLGRDLDGESTGDLSGRSVSLAADGRTLVVGAIDSDGDAGTDSGQAKVYRVGLTIDEDIPISVGGLSVTDANSNLASVQLIVLQGMLQVDVSGGAVITAGENGSASLTLSGSEAEINAALATVSYQGAEHFHGHDVLTLTSTDAAGLNDTDAIAIQVNPVNDPPMVAEAIAPQSAPLNVAFSFALPSNSFTDPDTDDNLSFSASQTNGSALPAWLSFDTNSQTFSGTPTADDIGTATLRITASDNAQESTFQDFTLAVTAGSPDPIDLPDFNGDGSSDILMRRGDRTVIQLLDQTTETTTTELLPAIRDEHWQVKALGQFNNDTIFDLVWYNSATGQNVLWNMNAEQQPTEAIALPAMTDRNWDLRGSGDLEADGDSDLLWFNPETKEIKVWYLENGQRTSSDMLNPDLTESMTDANWQLAGSGDFDGNNTFDLLWYNLDTGIARIWFMDNALGRTAETDIGATVDPEATDLNWAIAGQGDYDQNGMSDIVWYNETTGASKLWLMQGATVTEVVSLALNVSA